MSKALDGREMTIEHDIEALEACLPRRLPEDYRKFLISPGEDDTEFLFPIRVPNPLANCGITRLMPVSELDAYDHDNQFLRIGNDMMSNGLFLSLRDPDLGSIWFFDAQQRECWQDERFYEMFANIAPEIEEYLQARQDGALPDKEAAMYSYYHVADSFTEFLAIREPFVLD